jgi:hypothetical protein
MKERLYFSVFALLLLGVLACGPSPQPPGSSSTLPFPELRVENFNTADISIKTNGNMSVAFHKLMKATASETWRDAREVSLAEITRKPFSSLGGLYKFSGEVYQVTELPPDSTGKWACVLLQCTNPNSPAFGITSVVLWYNGDLKGVDVNTKITCAGYFVGTSAGTSVSGGNKVEGFNFVGNSLKVGYGP